MSIFQRDTEMDINGRQLHMSRKLAVIHPAEVDGGVEMNWVQSHVDVGSIDCEHRSRRWSWWHRDVLLEV